MKQILLCFAACVAALSSLQSGNPETGFSGRYQLIVGPIIDGNTILYRIDTQTGKTWVYDAAQQDIMLPEHAAQVCTDPTKVAGLEAKLREDIKKANKYVFLQNPHWKELSEKLESFSASGEDTKKLLGK